MKSLWMMEWRVNMLVAWAASIKPARIVCTWGCGKLMRERSPWRVTINQFFRADNGSFCQMIRPFSRLCKDDGKGINQKQNKSYQGGLENGQSMWLHLTSMQALKLKTCCPSRQYPHRWFSYLDEVTNQYIAHPSRQSLIDLGQAICI